MLCHAELMHEPLLPMTVKSSRRHLQFLCSVVLLVEDTGEVVETLFRGTAILHRFEVCHHLCKRIHADAFEHSEGIDETELPAVTACLCLCHSIDRHTANSLQALSGYGLNDARRSAREVVERIACEGRCGRGCLCTREGRSVGKCLAHAHNLWRGVRLSGKANHLLECVGMATVCL